jgi:hypothetical protein
MYSAEDVCDLHTPHNMRSFYLLRLDAFLNAQTGYKLYHGLPSTTAKELHLKDYVTTN